MKSKRKRILKEIEDELRQAKEGRSETNRSDDHDRQ